MGETLLALRTITSDFRAAIRDHLPDLEHQRQVRITIRELGLDG